MKCKLHIQVSIHTGAQPTSRSCFMESMYVFSQSECYFVNVISRSISLQLLYMQSAPFTLLV